MREFAVLVMNVIIRPFEGTFFKHTRTQFIGKIATLVINSFLKLYEFIFCIDR